jgi:hypothetical protein
MQVIKLSELSAQFDRYLRCLNDPNHKHNEEDAEERINLMLELLPSGSGIDSGTTFLWDVSKPDKLVFSFEFHHMEDGYYSGWTNHKLILTPSFTGFRMRITGKDRNQIKEYLYDLFSSVFTD